MGIIITAKVQVGSLATTQRDINVIESGPHGRTVNILGRVVCMTVWPSQFFQVQGPKSKIQNPQNKVQDPELTKIDSTPRSNVP